LVVTETTNRYFLETTEANSLGVDWSVRANWMASSTDIAAGTFERMTPRAVLPIRFLAALSKNTSSTSSVPSEAM
jgi:hypothetical protein